jgi:hypothetical protein
LPAWKVTKVRSFRFAPVVVLVFVISMFLFSNMASENALAAELKTVYGYVKDSGGNPVDGATVTVRMKDPDTQEVRSFGTTTTASGGFYAVTFGGFNGLEWLVGDILEVEVEKDAQSVIDNNQFADAGIMQEVDVTWPDLIPEFGAGFGAAVAAVAIAGVAVAVVGRRKSLF